MKTVQLTENEVRGLCLKSREIFLTQPILLELEAPLKICGTYMSQAEVWNIWARGPVNGPLIHCTVYGLFLDCLQFRVYLKGHDWNIALLLSLAENISMANRSCTIDSYCIQYYPGSKLTSFPCPAQLSVTCSIENSRRENLGTRLVSKRAVTMHWEWWVLIRIRIGPYHTDRHPNTCVLCTH